MSHVSRHKTLAQGLRTLYISITLWLLSSDVLPNINIFLIENASQVVEKVVRTIKQRISKTISISQLKYLFLTKY